MIYIVVLVIGFVIGYSFAVWGSMENLKSKRMFYLRDDGTWYPCDPSEARRDERAK